MNPSHKRNVSYPDVIAGFCTATLENCPDHQLNENHCQTIQRFFRNNLYTHTLSIVVYVRLWESPANYLRKHLGLSNYWTRSNGTVLSVEAVKNSPEVEVDTLYFSQPHIVHV